MENKINITTVDLGNMNIKWIGENGKGMFSSKISTDYQAYQEGLNRIEMMDGKITYLGIGELSREFNKAERDYMAQLLYAISIANKGDVIETSLCLLLPSLQMDNKKKLIENLKEKEFSFKFNGMDRMVKINEMMVLPEGLATFYSLTEEEQEKDLCILDLGSRTINICCMVDSEIQLLQTIKYGSFDFYNKIRTLENGKGEDYKEEDIPRLIKNGTIKVIQKQMAEFLQEILNYIKPYVNIKTYSCIFTGGTSLMLQDYIIKIPFIEARVLENALESNAIGAMNASKLAWEISV